MYAKKFKTISGTYAVPEGELLLRVSGDGLEKMRKRLTLRNKSEQWKLKKLKESRTFYTQKLQYFQNNKPDAEDKIKFFDEKVQQLDQDIRDTEGRVKFYLYKDNEDGTISIPSGLWYLCSSIQGDPHANTTITPYYMDILRHYQVEGLEELYKYNRATIEMATGLGKSKMIYSVAMAAAKSDKRTMIIVPSEYLVEQAYEELKTLHDNVAALGGKYKKAKLGWEILVTTVDSAIKHIDQPEVIIVDECHHSPAKKWLDFLGNADQATHVYNFTATAFRNDGLDKAIHAFGGPVVFSRSARWGIDNGWLTPLKVMQVKITPKKSDGTGTRLPEYMNMNKAYSQSIKPNVSKFLMDRLKAGLDKGRKVITIFRTVNDAITFSSICKAEGGPKFGVAHSDKRKSKNPKGPMYDFIDNKTNLLVACDRLISEGIDIPSADLLILVTQNSSPITTYQMVGRVLRKSPGKEAAVVLDVSFQGYKQFESAAQKREAIYREITDDVSIVTV